MSSSGVQPVPILLAVRSLGHGGSERQLTNIALAVDRSCLSPHVVSVVGGFQADKLRQANVPVLHLALRSFATPSVLKVARELREYILRNRIRLVHTFDHTLSLLGIPVAKSCPGVIALSSQRAYMELVPAKYKWPFLLTHRMAHGVVANCEALRRHLINDYSYPADRISVCLNGLDVDRFSPVGRRRLPGTENASLVIGTVCVLRPEKNLGHLLEAFARVRSLRPDMKLLIVGSGPEREKLIRLSSQLELTGDCIFLPSTPDVPAAMRGIDVFVHPSLSEGLPNGVMEAMACGCTVVANRVGGCPELIDEKQTGFLAQPGDLDSLASQLGAAIAQDTLRAQIAVDAAQRMKDFSLSRSALCMQQIYRNYLDRLEAS